MQFLSALNRRLTDYRDQLVIIACIVCLLLCVGIALFEDSTDRQEPSLGINTHATSMTPTKWWIKRTATSLVTATAQVTIRTPQESSHDKCLDHVSTDLSPHMYAYISLGDVPNRVRSNAGLSGAYVNQIDPGKGVYIVDGPVCVDGFSWWQVETIEGNLRGWTVDGDGNTRWILPCPNRQAPCSKQATATPIETPSPKRVKNNICRSENLAVDMLAQVKRDSILILRTQPVTGEIVGRAGPMTTIRIAEGPICADNTVWWKVELSATNLIGWAAENNLQPCTEEDKCTLED